MEQINTLLNLPEYATASDRACAVYDLMQQHDNIQAARASAEHELMALRSATSHIFAESICAARGITDADAQEDIRAAWCADPYAALNALAGENITAANPYGCNQYGHEWRGKHGEGWQPRGDRQRDKKKDKEDKQKGKNLSDALKKIALRTDKNGQGLMPFAGNKNASSSVQNVMNKYNTLREKAENKINELQKIKSDSSKNWEEKNDAYEQWSDIYNSIIALNNDFANFDKYDESRKKMAEKDMAYHIKRLEEDINR